MFQILIPNNFQRSKKEQQDPAQVYSIQERIGKGSFGEVYKA